MDRPAPDGAAHTTDETLLSRFAQGDRCALGELARRYETALLGLARGLLDANADDACEAVQETWIRIIRYAHSFRSDSSFKTWIYRIVINQCHNIRERNRRAARSRARQRQSAPGRDAPPRHTALPPAEHAESLDRLRSEVSRLDPERRVLLLLCYHDGFTHQQAAEILGLPLGTLKSRLHATLTELRRRMPDEVRT